MNQYEVVDAVVSPSGHLEVLSQSEVSKLLDTSKGGLYKLFRNCSLAVLNSGSNLDDGKELLERYKSFDIRVIQEERGIKLAVKGAPTAAFVDGKMIKGIAVRRRPEGRESVDCAEAVPAASPITAARRAAPRRRVPFILNLMVLESH